MGIPSVNTLSDHKLVNFNVPNYLIKNFDNLVRFKRVSRTSMLVHLMETYIRSESKRLREDNDLNKMIVDLKHRNRKEIKEEIKENWEPPMIPYSSDEGWEDRLLKL